MHIQTSAAPASKLEGAFFGDLGCGIGGRKDFDANLRDARQKGNVLANLIPPSIKPNDINSFDAVSGRNRAGSSMVIGTVDINFTALPLDSPIIGWRIGE